MARSVARGITAKSADNTKVVMALAAGGATPLRMSETEVLPVLVLLELVVLEISQRRRTAWIDALDSDEAPHLRAPAKRTGEIAREPLERPARIGVRCEGVHECRFQIRAGLEALTFDQLVIHVPHAEPARLIHRQQRIECGTAFDHRGESVPCGRPRVYYHLRIQYSAPAHYWMRIASPRSSRLHRGSSRTHGEVPSVKEIGG